MGILIIVAWIFSLFFSYSILGWNGFALAFFFGPLGVIAAAILSLNPRFNNNIVIPVRCVEKKNDSWEKMKNKDQEEFEKHLNNIKDNK